MKKWVKTNLFWHLLAFASAFLLTVVVVYGIAFVKGSSEKPILISHLVKGQQMEQRGRYGNYEKLEIAELDIMASLKNPDQLTIFASSELGDSPFCSIQFLPDSLGIPTLGVGHAYHQCLSILGELLAAREYLKNSKICIVLSPGWFEVGGTNAEAFVEFLQPNFMDRIWLDKEIDVAYKIHIGKFISNNKDLFTTISPQMYRFLDLYTSEGNNSSAGFGFVNRSLNNLVKTAKNSHPNSFHKIRKAEYEFTLLPKMKRLVYENFDRDSENARKTQLAAFSNNNIFVDSSYFRTQVSDKNGEHHPGNMYAIDFENNAEVEDLKQLLRYLKQQGANCSFVLQPLNPYHFVGIEENEGAMKKIVQLVENSGFPILNLYVSSKEDYEPGILRDVMHFSDFGWMKVNKFLANQYGK